MAYAEIDSVVTSSPNWLREILITTIGTVLASVILGVYGARRRKARAELATVPLVDSWQVHSIRDGDDPYLSGVYDLLKKRGLLNSQAGYGSLENLCQWMDDGAKNRSANPRFWEMMRVALRDGQIGAVIWGTYYPRSKFLFVSYLASHRESAGRGGAVRAILDRLREELATGDLSGCEGIIFEIEDPYDAPSARRRIFLRYGEDRGWCSGQLAVDYIEARTITGETGEARRGLCVLLAPRLVRANSKFLSYELAAKIIDFVYSDMYADAVTDSPESHGWTKEMADAHAEYLRSLREKVLPQVFAADESIQRIARLQHPDGIELIRSG